MQTILETPRLVLRELSLGDLDFMASMLAHPEVMRFYPKCYSRDEAAAWIRRQMDRYAQHGHGGWLALDRATGEPRGQVGLIPQTIDGVPETEIGYLIHRPFQRRGAADRRWKVAPTRGKVPCTLRAGEPLGRTQALPTWCTPS